MSKKNEYLHIRINEELKEKLRQRAQAEGRSLSNYVEQVLRESLEGVDFKKL